MEAPATHKECVFPDRKLYTIEYFEVVIRCSSGLLKQRKSLKKSFIKISTLKKCNFQVMLYYIYKTIFWF